MKTLEATIFVGDGAPDWSKQMASPLLGVLVVAAVAIWLVKPRKRREWEDDE